MGKMGLGRSGRIIRLRLSPQKANLQETKSTASRCNDGTRSAHSKIQCRTTDTAHCIFADTSSQRIEAQHGTVWHNKARQQTGATKQSTVWYSMASHAHHWHSWQSTVHPFRISSHGTKQQSTYVASPFCRTDQVIPWRRLMREKGSPVGVSKACSSRSPRSLARTNKTSV